MNPLLVVLTTLPDKLTALDISRILVTEKLVACAQVLPAILSTYVWQEQLCVEEEYLLLLKTCTDRYDNLEARLRTIHPYAEPEIIALPVSASSLGYGQWVESVCRVADDRG